MTIQNKTYPIRVRFTKNIVAEVMFPKRQTGKVAILAIGLPSSPSKRGVLEFLSEKGYVAIFPRYRGTWESEGNFLEKSPALDIRDVISDLTKHKTVKDLFSGETKRVRVTAIHLFGSSFGGPAVLLNSHLPIVKKIIAVSPVIDWKKEGESEPFPIFVKFTQEAFGDAFRTKHTKDWQKLVKTDFYNPIQHTSSIDGKKIFIIHTKDDKIVPYEPLIPFAEKTCSLYYLKPKGGHLSISHLTHLFYWKKISHFLNKKDKR
jgi:esterase/lipase